MKLTPLSHTFFLALCLLCIKAGFAQKSKADALYAKAEYFRAIPKYEKAIRGESGAAKQECLIRLADCYRQLKNYQAAERSYSEALALGPVAPEVHYNYGDVLKTNVKYTEALTQYNAYLAGKPGDALAANAIRSCKEIRYWQSKPQEYKIEPMTGINTGGSEFCAVPLGNRIVYIAEKQQDMMEFSKSDMNGHPYLDIYYVNADDTDGHSRQLSKKINTSYHDGPVAFSADGHTMYLTRVSYEVKHRSDFVNRAKLYVSQGGEGRWSKPQPFAYNSDAYSCAHASLSADGNTLFFVSDMPGGFGGKDLWACTKNGSEWGSPQNLGPDINTSGDEMFPCMRKDGLLFFSSNGLPGFGGLDVFSARQLNGKWVLRRNEGLYINGPADDFGISFNSDSTGYFSSNREGGKGGDDVYRFNFTNKYITVSGTVLLTESLDNPAVDLKVYLLDKDARRLDSTRTNKKGYFEFNNLDGEKSYMAEVDDSDPVIKNKARFYMADSRNQIARVTHHGEGGKFIFKNLPADPNGLPDLFEEEEMSLAGNLLYGENPSKPLANKKVVIKNEYGDIVEETRSNEFGAFAFRNLPTDQSYTLYIDDADVPADTKITLTNKSGKEIKVLRSDANGKFKFNLLSSDKGSLHDMEVEDADLVMALSGALYDQDKKPLANANVIVMDNDKAVQNILTDAAGRFRFKNLNTDKTYLFVIDDPDNTFKSVTKIYVADPKGRIYRELRRDSRGKFQFSLLQADKFALGDYSVDDPWLEVLELKNKQRQEALTIIESLHYAYGDWKIDAAGTKILDKVISVLNSNPNLDIELSSHTDSRSSDQYNLQLSQKRARAAVEYMIAKGIARTRLKAVGYGETRLLNNCANGVECSEEEHAKNRRTEFKIVDRTKS